MPISTADATQHPHRTWAENDGRSAGERRRRMTLLAMCVATFMIQIDVTIVNVTLPAIQTGLHTSPGGLEWVISGYALALAALIPVGGALGDRYGRKRVLLVGLGIFTAASMACALAPDATALIAFRALQGVGGAAMLALSLSILTDTFPIEQRAAAIGTWSAVGGTGFGFGPVAGGLLLSVAGWPVVFWVNVPIGALAILITAVAVRDSRDAAPRRLDGPGATLSALGLVGLTLGLVNAASHPWPSVPVIVPLLVGAALLAAFFSWQHRCRAPMIPPTLLRARSFASAAATYLISYTAFSGVLFYVTLLYQDVLGWSALRTGLSWLAMNIPFLIAAQLAGRLNRCIPPRATISGGCLAAAGGVLALSFVNHTSPFALTVVGYLISGAGFGTLVPAITNAAMRDVPVDVSGAASGIVNASRQIGSSVGIAVLGSIGISAAMSAWARTAEAFPAAIRSAAREQAHNVGGGRLAEVRDALGPAFQPAAGVAFTAGYHLALLIATTCLLAAALIAVIGFRPRRPTMHSKAGHAPDQSGRVERISVSGGRAGRWR